METLISFLPAAGVVVAVIATLFIVNRVLERNLAAIAGRQFRNQLIMLALTGVGLLIIILVVPMSDAMRGQVLGLIGILLSAAIALSSTTFIGNIL